MNQKFNWKRFRDIAELSFVAFVLGVGIPATFVFGRSYLEQVAPPVLAVLNPFPEANLAPPSIESVVPNEGKFIAADLVNMRLTLYENGAATGTFPILTKGRPGTPYETPAGMYKVLTKEVNHFNRSARVNMPYSMQFLGNYFVHGWPTYEDGRDVSLDFSGGCIRLSTEDAEAVFDFAARGVPLYVFDTGAATSVPPLMVVRSTIPPVSAASYLVADLDNGDVYAQRDAGTPRPIGSVAKLMTALVANETIMFDRPIEIERGMLMNPRDEEDAEPLTFVVEDLLYPLLMRSSDSIADRLARYYGTGNFLSWMNSQAKALGMASTHFEDASGTSTLNASTAEDLYRLSVYLSNKKSFVFKVSRTDEKTITADEGGRFELENINALAGHDSFIGGGMGEDAMVSLFSYQIEGMKRRIAVIVLGSSEGMADTEVLANWFANTARTTSGTACVACRELEYRKIEL